MVKDGSVEYHGPPSQMVLNDHQGDRKTSDMNYSMLCTPSLTGRNSPTLETRDHDDTSDSITDIGDHNTSVQVEPERRETGTVKMKVYKQYWRAVGPWLSSLIMMSLLAMQTTRNLTDVWLANWVSHSANTTAPNTSHYEETRYNFDGGPHFILLSFLYQFV